MKKVLLSDRWLVIGSSSLTGSRFLELTGGEIETVDFPDFDVTNKNQVIDAIKKFQGKYVINFSGATLVDEIEKTRPKDPDDVDQLNNNMAYRINVIGIENIIEACRESGKFPIFISTSFVFDGRSGPYSEEDEKAKDPNLVSWYAWTKILAEKAVERFGIETLTLRISYPYKRSLKTKFSSKLSNFVYRSEFSGKTDFARNMLRLFDEGKLYPIFADQKLTPTFIDDVAPAVALLVDKGITGIVHLTSPEITTPYDFCVELLRFARGIENPGLKVSKGSIVSFQAAHPEVAKRPVRGGEKCDKIIKLGFTPTDWREGIKIAYGK